MNRSEQFAYCVGILESNKAEVIENILSALNSPKEKQKGLHGIPDEIWREAIYFCIREYQRTILAR